MTSNTVSSTTNATITSNTINATTNNARVAAESRDESPRSGEARVKELRAIYIYIYMHTYNIGIAGLPKTTVFREDPDSDIYIYVCGICI